MSDQNPTPPGDDPIFGEQPPASSDPVLGGGSTPVPPPPPPPPAPPAPPAPAPATRAGGANVGDAFSWALAKFGENAGIWLGLAAAVVVINVVGALVTRALVAGSTSTSSAGVAFTGLGLTFVVSILFAILGALASIGVYRAALRRTQGVTPSFDMITSTENLVPYILVAIVYGLLSIGGLLLCILPGLIVIFLFLFSPYFALDKGQGVGEALGNSFRLVTGNIGQVILAIIINAVASFLGSSGFLFGLLVLVTLPFSALFTSYVYRALQNEPVAP